LGGQLSKIHPGKLWRVWLIIDEIGSTIEEHIRKRKEEVKCSRIWTRM
jgi:hypothetical protein